MIAWTRAQPFCQPKEAKGPLALLKGKDKS
jgi:hypothetical protein